MSNQLTERELSRYMGTGVKCKFVNYDRSFIFDVTKPRNRYCELLLCGVAKFILHPLTDLTKPCLEGGKVPAEVIIELYCKRKNIPIIPMDKLSVKIDMDDIGNTPYWLIEWLHENHFNTGLDKDLWIDINTLEA